MESQAPWSTFFIPIPFLIYIAGLALRFPGGSSLAQTKAARKNA
jgi:hypothetical protein